jgi:LysM repeat protein
MNNLNPQMPQGSFLEEQKTKSKSNYLIAVLTILTLHVVLFGGMLIQGCKREEKKNVLAQNEITNALPPLDTNNLAPAAPPAETPPVTSPPPLAAMPPTNFAPPLTAAPPVAAPIEPATPAATKEYTVAKGDYFAKIAKSFGVSVAAIEKANPGIDPRKLKVGQIVQVPAAATAKTSPAGIGAGAGEPAAAEAGKTVSYTVRPGDTLTRIARIHGITVKALRGANNLKTDQLHVGQKLRLPAAKAASSPAPTGFPPAEPAPGTTSPAPLASPATGGGQI